MIDCQDIIRSKFKKYGHNYEKEITIHQGYAIFESMDEYAKEIAIGFYDFVVEKYRQTPASYPTYVTSIDYYSEENLDKATKYTIEYIYYQYIQTLNQ